MRPPSFWNFFGSLQELDDFLHFFLGFLDAGDVLERDLVLVPGEHPRLALAEIERALAGHPNLLAEEQVEDRPGKRRSAGSRPVFAPARSTPCESRAESPRRQAAPGDWC